MLFVTVILPDALQLTFVSFLKSLTKTPSLQLMGVFVFVKSTTLPNRSQIEIASPGQSCLQMAAIFM